MSYRALRAIYSPTEQCFLYIMVVGTDINHPAPPKTCTQTRKINKKDEISS